MARLEGKKPNAGAIITGAVIFALIAAGLFFAFRPVPEPTDAGLSNSAAPAPTASSDDSNDTSGESDNSLTTILTPLPLATPANTSSLTEAPTDNGAMAPTGNGAMSPTDNSVITPTDNSAMAPMENSVITPMETPAINLAPTPNAR